MLPSDFSNHNTANHTSINNNADAMADQQRYQQKHIPQSGVRSSALPPQLGTERSQSWTPNKSIRRVPVSHQRTQSVPHTVASVRHHDEAVPSLLPSATFSATPTVWRRPNNMVPQSKFSTQYSTPPRPKHYDALSTSSPGAPRALDPSPVIRRSFTESSAETGRERAIRQFIRDTDKVYEQLGASLLPDGFQPLERPQASREPFADPHSPERARAWRGSVTPTRANTVRSSQQPPRRFDFASRQITRATSLQVLPLVQKQQQQQQQNSVSAETPPTMTSPLSRKERKQAAKGQRRGRSVAESVADVFSSFQKIEADEMLTRKDLQRMRELRELREHHEAQLLLEEQKSWDITAKLESLASKPRQPTSEPAPPLPRQTSAPEGSRIIRMPDDVFSPEFDSALVAAGAGADADVDADADADADASSHPRSASPFQPKLGPLPMAPRLRITTFDGESRQKTIPRRPVGIGNTAKPNSFDFFKPTETDTLVLLKSNPCTITMPTFRHGPIRFDKEETDPKLGADENLDWTAFQMAILGGAGEYEEFNEEDEIEQANELQSWFSSFGFPSAGRLLHEPEDDSAATTTTATAKATATTTAPANAATTVTTIVQAPAPPHSPSSIASLSPVSSNASTASPDTDPDTAAPHPRDFSSPFWKSQADFEMLSPAPPVPKVDSPAADLARWSTSPYMETGTPGKIARKPIHRNSVDSLPQSPMLSLGETDADEVEVVPMGYNLGHDLGDFLKWESEQMYAAAFYGA